MIAGIGALNYAPGSAATESESTHGRVNQGAQTIEFRALFRDRSSPTLSGRGAFKGAELLQGRWEARTPAAPSYAEQLAGLAVSALRAKALLDRGRGVGHPTGVITVSTEANPCHRH